MSFQIKQQIMHVIRQRQQKKIAEENSFYFDILQKALPQEPSKPTEENGKEKSAVEEVSSSSSQHNQQSDHRDGKPRVSPKVNHQGGGGGGGKTTNRERTGSSSGKHGKSGGSKTQEHHRSNSSKSQSQSTNDHHHHQSASSAAAAAIPNGDLPRPSSAGKVHVVGGKKQLAVKAVPRSNQPSADAAAPATGSAQDTVKDKVTGESVLLLALSRVRVIFEFFILHVEF